MRERIVFIYDFFLPIYVRFSNEVAEYYDPIIGELESEIIESKVVRTTNNKFEIQDFPSIDNISQSTVLARILKLQQNKYNNYTSRLKDMRRFQENLKLQLQKELGQTQN